MTGILQLPSLSLILQEKHSPALMNQDSRLFLVCKLFGIKDLCPCLICQQNHPIHINQVHVYVNARLL